MKASKAEYLSFKAGDVLTVLGSFKSWHRCELDGRVGMVPKNYVKPISLEFEEEQKRLQRKSSKVGESMENESREEGDVLRGSKDNDADVDDKRAVDVTPEVPYLSLAISRARRLPLVTSDDERKGPPNAFIEVIVDNNSDGIQKSPVVSRSTAPEWRKEFLVPLKDCSEFNCDIRVAVRHQDMRVADKQEFIGELCLPLAYFVEYGQRSAWFPLQAHAARGQVHLRLSHIADGGSLDVEIVGARGLLPADPQQPFCSPFAVLSVGDGYRTQTPHLEANSAPVWQQKCHVPNVKRRDDLVLEIFDQTPSEAPSLMGALLLPLETLGESSEVDDWFTITRKQVNTSQGDIFIDAKMHTSEKK